MIHWKLTTTTKQQPTLRFFIVFVLFYFAKIFKNVTTLSKSFSSCKVFIVLSIKEYSTSEIPIFFDKVFLSNQNLSLSHIFQRTILFFVVLFTSIIIIMSTYNTEMNETERTTTNNTYTATRTIEYDFKYETDQGTFPKKKKITVFFPICFRYYFIFLFLKKGVLYSCTTFHFILCSCFLLLGLLFCTT